MILTGTDDYEYPHIDWICDVCGAVYCSAGKPDTDYCAGGHHEAQWSPEPEQIEAYIDTLESLDPGDGVVLCGDGPAPLMGPVESTDGNSLITESIDSPRREVRWRDSDHEDGPAVEFRDADDEYAIFSDVYHVETVEIQTTAAGTTGAEA